MGGDDFVGVFDFAVGGDGNWLRHFYQRVGRGDVPALGEVAWSGGVLRVAGGGRGLRPVGDGGDFLIGERGVVGEVAVVWIGEPRGHHFHFYFVGDLLGPGFGFGVRGQRHGGNFAGAVAGLAVVLEDGEDIFVEGGRGFFGRVGDRHTGHDEG